MNNYEDQNYSVSAQDKVAIESLVHKIEEAAKDMNNLMIISLDDLCAMLTEEESDHLKRVYFIDPTLSGFKKPKSGMEPVPENIKIIPPQPYGEKQLTHTQYVPAEAYEAYMLMSKAMEKTIGRKLLIEASYRSSASQAFYFLQTLVRNNYDLVATVQHAAVPGYSEHSTPSKLAFDFKNVDGIPTLELSEEFASTQEYEWLEHNAYKYDFYLTYPKDNTYGVMFEPWHWRHIPPKED